MDFSYKYTYQQDAFEKKIYREFGAPLPPDYDAEGRYTLLKNYTANLQFGGYKCMYQLGSIDGEGVPQENELSHISSAIVKLNVIRLHDSITNSQKKEKLLKEAKYRLLNDSFGEVENEQYLKLLIYSLHQQKWFEVFPLPDEAFELDVHQNRIEIIGEVFGEYFLFYDYLQSQFTANSGKTFSDKQGSSKPKQRNVQYLKDLFLEETKKKGVYEAVITLLHRPLPDSITNACELKEDTRFLQFDDGKMYWSQGIYGSFRYLAGLYKVLQDKGWIMEVPKYYQPTAVASFNVEMSRNAFGAMRTENLDEHYMKPFRLLFKHI